ncbi:MAG: nicotinate phosphoribosyltransferase [Planctomycetes bacterium]|nr:nicotinate phosphoribosyltransferase [Planctomycetota bacterium]
MANPKPLFLDESNLGPVTDLYELTMAAAYFENQITHTATFELFVRQLPPNRSYLVVAGLEQALHYLTNIRFSAESIAYLRSHPSFKHVGDKFFEYLRQFRFMGEVHAMPEGALAFAGEPLLRVTAPIIEAQLVETYLLATVNFQTLIASKAARVVQAAAGRSVIDFGTRRAHGPQAGALAARACFIGGCTATSNVFAGQQLGIPIAGTMAHSWNMAFDDELEAFQKYHRVFPDSTILLIDTYDTLEGARKAAKIGDKLKAVRLDSGDLIALSKQVRRILDDAGLRQTKIIGSGDLNEYRIAELLAADAPIDLFGVGTEMVTSKDCPALQGVYKLVEQESGGQTKPRLKRSPEKASYPGKKQVFRRSDRAGLYGGDVIALHSEQLPGDPLLTSVMRDGQLAADLPSLTAIQRRAKDGLARLPDRFKRLTDAPAYAVTRSDALERLRESAERAYLG